MWTRGQRTDSKRKASAPVFVLILIALTARGGPGMAMEPAGEGEGPVTAAPTDPPAGISDARRLFTHGEYEQAAELFERLLDDPEQADGARVGLAEVQIRIGDYEEAIKTLASPTPATSADARYVRAQAYVIKGRYEDALVEAREAIALKGDHAGARRLLGETLDLLGRREKAVEAFAWFDRQLVARDELRRDATWLTDVALGFYRYSVLTGTDVPRRTQHVLHNMLQPAYERLDRTFTPARIAAGDLLREKFNNAEEDGSVSDYKAALRINSRLCEAHVGLGAVALSGWDFEAVDEHVEQALAVNARFAPALHLSARKLVTERRYDQAIEVCDRALAINDRDLIALSVRAAAAACQYDDATVARMRERVSAVNPRCALFDRTLGDAWGGIRQYEASERAYLAAIELDPTDANARTELGMMYMQWGREDKARRALDAAWVLDPYNQRTKFTLDLLDSLHKYAQHETEHFVVRYDAERDPGFGEYVADFLERIYEDVTGDYEWPLREKTIIEVFPTQRAFAVRITGKPWIHTIGACTGRVIAFASPREAPDLSGHYDFARVLTHEFTHTVTLAATRNRIPHWFTEGLAVLQEDSVRSFAWVELLADAVRRGELFTLDSIDWGFIRPKRPTDRQLAYAQSEWMCEYIIERFGYDVINTMLRRLREGRPQREVFIDVLGIEPKDFDTGFGAWAKEQVLAWGMGVTPPEDVAALRASAAEAVEDAALWGRLAKAEYDAGAFERAFTAARHALERDENNAKGLEVMAGVLMKLAAQETTRAERNAHYDRATAVLRRLRRVDPTGWTAPKYQAEIALWRGEGELAIEPLERLQRLCPMDPASWRGLGGVHLEAGDDDRALPQLLELARIEEGDAEVRARIGRIYRRRGSLREARYWYRQALYVNPFSIPWHEALGEVSMMTGDTAGALREYRMLAALEPATAHHWEQAAFAAHKLGDADKAGEFARKAVALSPDSPARTLLP